MNTTTRTLVLCFLLSFIPNCAGLAAQEHQAEAGLAKVDTASRAATNSLVQTLRTLPMQDGKYRLQLGNFALEGERAPLASLWANNLVTFLTSAAAAPGANIVLTLQNSPPPDYLVEGELILAVDTVRIYTRLVRMADGTMLLGFWSDLALDPVLAGMVVPVSSADSTGRDNYEPDSRESPKTVDLGQDPVERTLHTGDEDWFMVQATTSGILVAETIGDMDTIMFLYESGSSSPLQEDDDSGDGDNARIEFPVTARQTILINIAGYEGATGTYSFSTFLEPLPPQTGRNDTRERAARLALDLESSRLILERPDDADWFSVTVPAAGGVLQVKTTGGLDMLMELYDDRGNKLAEDDDSGENGNAMLTRLLQPGVYYLKLYEYEGKSGIYRLEAKLVDAGPADQYEPDDTMDNARPIRPGSPQRRNFNHPGDTDWAMLEVTRAGTYGISARPPRDNGPDTYIELYDAAGQLLDEDDDGGQNLDAYLEAELATGRYFIKVWQIDEEVPGDGSYELTVRIP